MTWKEFKEEAESKGITDDMKVYCIDVSYPAELDVVADPWDRDNGEFGIRIFNA